MAIAHPIPTDRRFIDLTEKMFERLTVQSYAGKIKGAPYWNCLCSCGKEKIIAGTSLKQGLSQSCGCLRSERTSSAKTTHGKSRSPEWKVWNGMIRRCHTETHTCFYKYGERGISVCERWRKSFANFLADMGERPSAKHQIERKENNGNYEPGNCIWATAKVQARNRRSTVFLTHDGLTMCLTDWSAKTGLQRETISARMKRGLPQSACLDPSTAWRYRKKKR